MKHIKNNSTRFRTGNAVLDMVFVLPILLGLTFGSVEYGYALYVKHALQGAAREGARAAIVAGATAASVQASIDNAMSVAGFPQSKYNRPATISPSNWATQPAGTAITVTVSTTWGMQNMKLLPSPPGISSSKALSGATTMRKEG